MSARTPALARRSQRDEWLSIEMRHLSALVAIAEEGSFAEAAVRLGYVQSAVSHQIAYLERAVGQPLITRSPRPHSVRLTDVGTVLVEHVRSILEELSHATDAVSVVAAGANEPVRLGLASNCAAWLSRPLLARMLAASGTSPQLEMAVSPQLLGAVARQELEAALVELPIASGPFFAMELLREEHVLALPPAAARCRRPEDVLARWPLVVIDDCRATKALRARLKVSRDSPSPGHRADSPGAALTLVRAGVATAVVTARDLAHAEAVETLPLPGVPDRVVGLAWHRARDDDPKLVLFRHGVRQALAQNDDYLGGYTHLGSI